MAHDVFFSYSTKDKSAADATCHALEARGIRCWIAPRDIPSGSGWREQIIDALDESRALVLVFSSNANESKQVERELSIAVDNSEIPILPLRIENVLPSRGFRFSLAGVHWLDALNPPLETHLERLADRISGLLAADEASGPGDRGTSQSPSEGEGSEDRDKSIDPDDADAWYKKGDALYNQKRYEEAIEAYDRAIRINPDAPYAWYSKGIALEDLGCHQEAIEARDRALRIDPNLRMPPRSRRE